MVKKVILAYSGGLDTSVILHWLARENDVIAFCADIGQGDDMGALSKKAFATGARECVIYDLRDEFATDFVFPMLQGGALYEGRYLLGTAIARPCIVRGLVECAVAKGAEAVAHGATGKGNDQVRFELGVAALAPDLKVIAPWRDPEFRKQFPGRAQMIDYAKENGIAVEATFEAPYSTDRNLLHISYEGGVLEDPGFDSSVLPETYRMSVPPQKAPDKSEYINLRFSYGNCVAVGNVGFQRPRQVLEELNELGGRHGIGRVDMVENRFVGMKSRGVYETPGGTILAFAKRALEGVTLDREVMHLRDSLIPRYSEMIYNGFWFSPERQALQAFFTQSQVRVSGNVGLHLYKGNIILASVTSNDSLYDMAMATFEEGGGYDQGDATGFIHLQAMRLRLSCMSAGAGM